ncbi:disease resistance protein SUMM2 [Eucalyptus grandis]|uniref:disease resistance protein SUMM2 n=1 Tax=Eucalyptus grandis TaxID=71139 RepID=UPI00192EB4EE|nr:disease resistance protein SUMM2 [Eucalyptus grandis]
MPKERDRFREYVDDLQNRRWRCKFCGNEFAGSTPRIRAHLAGIPDHGIKACEKVKDPVRAEALETFNGKGSGLDKSTGGTSDEGMERTVFGASQSVLPSDDAWNPNDTQNSNQPWCAPQQPSCYRWTGIGTPSACPQDQVYLPTSDMSLDSLDTSQQPDLSNHRLDATYGSEIASSVQQLPMDWPTLCSLDLSELPALPQLPTHLESGREQQNSIGLSSFPNDQVLRNSMSNELQEFIGDGITPDSLLHSTNWSNNHHSLLENFHGSRDEIVNNFEEIQTNELHDPTVVSSLQIDSFPDVDGANRWRGCGQPCEVEVDPVCSNASPIDTVQHPGQLPPRCDKKDGNDVRRFPSLTPMDADPSIASQHSNFVDSLVLEPTTNTIGPSSSQASVPPQRRNILHQYINLETAQQNPTMPPSSWKSQLVTCQSETLMDMDPCIPSLSQAPNNAPPPSQILPRGTGLLGQSSLPELDMNEGVPITYHPNTGSNFEENKALKRKLELLYRKEVDVRDELNFAASLCLKKLRMEVANWLANVEKLRIDCTEAASEDCLPPHQQVDILMREAEDIRIQGKGLLKARETKASKLLEENMVGEAFQINTMKILEYLVGNQISRLGIYGMGGVGKTTIMVHTHNRLLEKTNDGKVLWITVSQDFNTQRLQDAIGEGLGLDIQQEKDMRKRATKLCNCLMESGKFIVILDDMWKHFDLKEVGIPDKADNIKLVLTTRSFEVCRQMQCQEMIKIEPLSHIEAESLFLEELGSEVTLNLETRPVVESIVRECAGLPLAIITMARSMRGVTDVFEWKDYLEKLRESDMGKTDMETQVLMKLEFSYKCLGNHEIQQCFLSCALYPEDELIDKFKLIEFFIDQGLIGRLNTREKQYIRGLTILNKLVNVCLLEVHGSMMKMHDLIRDMALHIMSVTSIVKARKGLRRIPSEEYWTDALEKISLMENNIEEFPLNMSPNCPKLSTFLLNGSLFCEVIPDSFFIQLLGLKVLNLSGCCLKELPNSISDLVNLRALLLQYCPGLRRIPFLGKLKSLRKLDICYSVRVEALEGLEMLVNLRYLDLSHTRIDRLPKGTLGALRNLQYLKVHIVNGEDITNLWALETLECYFEDVDDFNKFVRVAFEKRNNPRYYNLNVHQEELKDYMKVNDDAQFENCERGVDIATRSQAIVSVGGEINGSGVCILIPQDVQVLRVIDCDGTTNLSNVSLLENLEKLIIVKLKNLWVLNGGQDEEIINIRDSPAPAPTPLLFPSLRVLIIRKCPKLKYLFGHGPKFYLPHLREIAIHNCEEMVGIASPPPQPAPDLLV